MRWPLYFATIFAMCAAFCMPAAAAEKKFDKPDVMKLGAAVDLSSAVGLWQKTEGGKPAAWFMIFETQGVYNALLVKSFNDSNTRQNALLGTKVISDLKRKGKRYTGGKLTNLTNGGVVPSQVVLSPDGKVLSVQSVLPGLFGGDDTWNRLPATAVTDIDAAVLAKVTTQTTASAAPDVKALQPVFFATNRQVKDEVPFQLTSITPERSQAPDLRYGLTIVGVPKNHILGQVERPQIDLVKSIMSFGLVYEKETDKDHFRLRSMATLDRGKLVEALTQNADSVLLFIHGYNVPFDDAIFKAAQIAYDANFAGSVLVFSWPSAGAIMGYDHDRESALFSSEDLLKVLDLLSSDIGEKRVFVLAHSLGNEIVMNALQQAALKKSSLRISELMLAAPDVDKDVFVRKAADIRSVATNMTLYASSADKALLASQKKAWGTRMGFVGADGPTLIDGIETIDVTAVGADMLGLDHSTFSTARAVLEDVGHLIMRTQDQVHLPPHKRLATLKFMPDQKNLKYWLFPK